MGGTMLEKMRSALADGKLIPPGSRVIVALSGGADSIALLHGLLTLRAEMDFGVCAAHLNHCIRGKFGDSDEDFCSRVCADWNVTLLVGRADCPKLAREKKLSLEEAAREARYAFLEDAARNMGAQRIAVAHHMDDQAETVLLNLFRGTGAAGMRAMSPVRGNIIRPLLSATRQELHDYVAEKGLAFVQDETNSNKKYTRNRLRSLDAELRRINPSYTKNVCRAASLLADDDDALCEWAKKELAEARDGSGALCGRLACLPPAVCSRALRMLAKEAGLSYDLGYRHVSAMCALLTSDTGAVAHLPKNYIARVSYGVITVVKRNDAESQEDYCIPLSLDGETETPCGTIVAEAVPRPVDLTEGAPFACFVPANALSGAVVRPRASGDVIRPLGAPGTKKLKDYYIDKKVDREDRTLPVVAVDNRVLWAVGAGLSDEAAVRNETGVVWLRFVPVE